MREQKATTLIEHLTYDITNETHSLDIFTKNQDEIIDEVRHIEVKKYLARSICRKLGVEVPNGA